MTNISIGSLLLKRNPFKDPIILILNDQSYVPNSITCLVFWKNAGKFGIREIDVNFLKRNYDDIRILIKDTATR